MPVFVQAHRRGSGLVKAYSRSSTYRSFRLARTIRKIGRHKNLMPGSKRASGQSWRRWDTIEDRLTDKLRVSLEAKKIKQYAGKGLAY